MRKLRRFPYYFLACGGVETDPCKCFLQNGIVPKCTYLGLPPSSNRKIHPRFCQNLHEKALSSICDDDQHSTLQFHPPFVVKSSSFYCSCAKFPSFQKENSVLQKIRQKSLIWEPTQVDQGESPLLSDCSDHTTRCVHARHSCISGLGRGDVADVIQRL